MTWVHCCSSRCSSLLAHHHHLFFHTKLGQLQIAICCSPLLALPLRSSLMYSILAFSETKRFPFLSFSSFLVVYILSPPHWAVLFSNKLSSPGPSFPLSCTSAVPELCCSSEGSLLTPSCSSVFSAVKRSAQPPHSTMLPPTPLTSWLPARCWGSPHSSIVIGFTLIFTNAMGHLNTCAQKLV